MINYQQIVQAAEELSYSFPLSSNRLKQIVQDYPYSPQEIETQAATARPLVHASLLPLAKAFLTVRKQHGSEVEKALYAEMSLPDFLDKLLRKRPLMFMTAEDSYFLRDGQTLSHGGFDAIGSDKEQAPLLLQDYNSYPEMQIAAMMGASVPTFFINSGNRFNQGQQAAIDSFEPSGVYTGLVGARFERPGLMEWQHLIVTPEQNTAENGYGLSADPQAWPTQALLPWATFYQEGNDDRFFLPDYDSVSQDESGTFIPFLENLFDSDTYYLNTSAYRHRMRMIIEPFLIDANARAADAGKQAFVIAVGYGIGVWALEGNPDDMNNPSDLSMKDIQAQLIVDTFADCIAHRSLPHISDLTFSWYPSSCQQCGSARNGDVLSSNGNHIRIHFNQDDPIKKLSGEHEGKLLVASYAWDGNSYPGNEYWKGMLAASGDPAAMCCSTLQELQNPDVNPAISGANVHVSQPQSSSMISLTDMI